LNLQKKSKT